MLEPKRRAWVEVSLEAIRANVRTLQTRLAPQAQLLAAVKADAYGHGLVPVSKAALEAGVVWLGAAAVAEGVALREAGVAAPILLLCPFAPQEAETALQYDLTATVGAEETVQALSAAAQRLPGKATPQVHLEIDTGIGRSGILPNRAWALWRLAVESGLNVKGLCTHFADADGEAETLSQAQLAAFQRARAALQDAGAVFDWVHLANSPGLLRYGSAEGNLARPGLALYGVSPAHPQTSLDLSPALSLKTRVATVRTLPTGHPISYGSTHRLTRPSRIATLLLGYGDGYPRRLSNRGSVLLRGRRAPILGRVCMDQLVADVTDLPEVTTGEEAVCIGVQGDERITVEEIAAQIETTEHEITTCLTARLPRVYISA